MSSVTTLSFEAATHPHGDALAEAIIAGYWQDLESGRARSHHGWWPRHVPGDRWVGRDRWLAVARRWLDEGGDPIGAYTILLAEGLTEYAPAALALVEDWAATSGHDPEYYLGILAHLPDSEVRRTYLSVEDPEQLCQDTDTRRALLSVGDPRACELVAERIVRELSVAAVAEDFADGPVVRLLADLGPLCRPYLPPEALTRAKELCLAALAKDQAVALAGAPPGDGARRIWIRDDLALLASRVGWLDVLRTLAAEPWYWPSLFDHDSDSDNLLTWSLHLSSDALKTQALAVMRSHTQARIDGAIAWVRLHAAQPLIPLEQAPGG